MLVTRFDSRNRFAGQHLNTFLTIELVQESGQIDRIDVAANCLAWEYHHNFPAVYGEGGGNLPSDKSSPNYGETPAALRDIPQPPIVVQSTIVDGASVLGREAPRRAASGQEQLLIAVVAALVVSDTLGTRVKRQHLAS